MPHFAVLGLIILSFRLVLFCFVQLGKIIIFLVSAPLFPKTPGTHTPGLRLFTPPPAPAQLVVIGNKPYVVSSQLLQQSGLTAEKINSAAFSATTTSSGLDGTPSKNELDLRAALVKMNYSHKTAQAAARETVRNNPGVEFNRLFTLSLAAAGRMG